MAAVTAGGTARKYSHVIVGGLVPQTSSESMYALAEDWNARATELDGHAAAIDGYVNRLVATYEGKTIDALAHRYQLDRIAVVQAADDYRAMGGAVQEFGWLLDDCRTRLDDIDAEAHQKIDQVMEDIQNRRIPAPLGFIQITQILAEYRAKAEVEAASNAEKITAETARVNERPLPQPRQSGGAPVQSSPDDKIVGEHDIEAKPLSNGSIPETPKNDLDNLPERPGAQTGGTGGWGESPNEGHDGDATNAEGGTDPKDHSAPGGKEGSEPASSDEKGRPTAQSSGSWNPSDSGVRDPAPVMPASGGGSGSSGGGSGFGGGGMPFGGGAPVRGGGSPASGLGSVGSVGSGSSPVSGVNPAAALGGSGAGGSPVPSAPPASPASDFSRGFSAGLGSPSGGAVLPPPVSPSPAAPVSSSSGAAPPSVGSGPVGAPSAPAAGGPAHVAGPGMSGTPMAAPMVPPHAGGGPLPAYGSDLAGRQVPAAPAAGPSTSIPSTPAGGGAGPGGPGVAPIPPGAVSSGVGAAAGADAALRSSRPDPVLEKASRLVYELMHASRMYGTIAWCVGVFETHAGMETMIVSNEGLGYVPPGVVVPRSARVVFSDGRLPDSFARQWFGHVNPAETMLAYAGELQNGIDRQAQLYAVAVSAYNGGSAAPAASSGVPQYASCALFDSPIDPNSPAAVPDSRHLHRLEATEPVEYQRWNGSAVGLDQQRAELWQTTREAFDDVMWRAARVEALPVSAAITEVFEALQNNVPVSAEQWLALEMARFDATMQASQVTIDGSHAGASAWSRASHNLARLAEMLLMWRDGPHFLEISYEARQIAHEARLWPEG